MLVWNQRSPAMVSRSLAALGGAEWPLLGGVWGCELLRAAREGPAPCGICDQGMCRMPGRPTWRGPWLVVGRPSGPGPGETTPCGGCCRPFTTEASNSAGVGQCFRPVPPPGRRGGPRPPRRLRPAELVMGTGPPRPSWAPGTVLPRPGVRAGLGATGGNLLGAVRRPSTACGLRGCMPPSWLPTTRSRLAAPMARRSHSREPMGDAGVAVAGIGVCRSWACCGALPTIGGGARETVSVKSAFCVPKRTSKEFLQPADCKASLTESARASASCAWCRPLPVCTPMRQGAQW
mmetsp:Transcript_102826/g.326859  ORF Transcript_102826/g.326859 Transcript_102826/m.326859 type:complete len:291 (-) Transcript_102826:325-1197(-)